MDKVILYGGIAVGVIAAIIIVIAIVRAITKAANSVSRTFNTLNNTMHTAFDGSLQDASRNAPSEYSAAPKRIIAPSEAEMKKLYSRFPEFNLESFKNKAVRIVSAVHTKPSDLESIKQLMTRDAQAMFTPATQKADFTITSSGITHYIDNEHNARCIFEVAYILNKVAAKDSVTFCNTMNEDISDTSKVLCPICGGAYSPNSLQLKRCEYCGTAMTAVDATWLCTDTHVLR